MARESGADLLAGGESDRRDFFRTTLGRLLKEVSERTERRVVPMPYFRPPGALDEVAFIAACTRCDECIRVCPAHAILKVPASGGFAAGTPMIDPKTQPCTACDEMLCADVCPTDALIRPPDIWHGYRMAVLELDPERCIAFGGVECGVCVRVCPVGDDAISLDSEGRPVLKMEGCVGCGVCVRACVTAPSSLSLDFR
ncbi:MAG: 4Fe-4S dicluster domain-containing protein [Gemmatimonadales bacterium]